MSRRDTGLAVPDFTNVKVDGINWETIDTHTPGGCPIVEWCEGRHPAPTKSTLRVFHGRTIGTAIRDDLESACVVEVAVAQWKAAPGVTWIEGESGPGWPNYDKPPQLAIFTYPTDGPGDGMWLHEQPWGAPLVTILRGIGHNAFADLLDTAVQFAHKLDEETQR